MAVRNAKKTPTTKAERAATRRANARPSVDVDEADVDDTPAPKKRDREQLRTVDAPNPGVGRVPAPHRSVAQPVPRNDLATPVVPARVPESAKARKARLKKVKPTRVVAVARGYYGDRLWEVGQKFDMIIDPELDPPRWVALIKKKKDEQTPEEEFGTGADDTHDDDDLTDEDEDDDADDEGEEEEDEEI